MPVRDHKYENDYIPNMVVYEKLYNNPDSPRIQRVGIITR